MAELARRKITGWVNNRGETTMTMRATLAGELVLTLTMPDKEKNSDIGHVEVFDLTLPQFEARELRDELIAWCRQNDPGNFTWGKTCTWNTK